jgi:hypothetical protein
VLERRRLAVAALRLAGLLPAGRAAQMAVGMPLPLRHRLEEAEVTRHLSVVVEEEWAEAAA